jgi:hypothetical protein
VPQYRELDAAFESAIGRVELLEQGIAAGKARLEGVLYVQLMGQNRLQQNKKQCMCREGNPRDTEDASATRYLQSLDTGVQYTKGTSVVSRISVSWTPGVVACM